MAKSSKKSKVLGENSSPPAASTNDAPTNAAPVLPAKPAPAEAPAAPASPAKAPRKSSTATARKTTTATKTAKPRKTTPRSNATPPKPAPAEFAVSEDEIRLRAYFISQYRHERGIAGDSASDWDEARRQLLEEAARLA